MYRKDAHTTFCIEPISKYMLAFELVRYSIQRRRISEMVNVPSEKRNKFNNIATSLIHSTITGIGSTIALCCTDITNDTIHGQSAFAYGLMNLSLGYFMFDMFDTLRLANWKIQ